KLASDLAATFPSDNRYRVVSGDCNTTIDEGLAHASELRWAPTFAFIDPKGLDVAWTTLEHLSKWRKDRQGRKVELWILLPEPAFERVLGLKGVRGVSSAERLTSVYGCDDWIAIHQRRWTEEFSPEQTRAEFVNLYRWRLQNTLGYKTTHALQLGNVSDQPMYTMVFATDAAAGSRIMSDVYHHAKVHEIPALRAHAVGVRRTMREMAMGVARLFEVGEAPVTSEGYSHSDPWAPPVRRDEEIEFDREPPPERDEESD
ncbi:MAG TPA: three-Cys-motif partner protein TcmP, partial [Acidimicrobiales bacterium]|nr:three-Cys-motif partner protein TcmP [Acidimicrobiales bacterium]